MIAIDDFGAHLKSLEHFQSDNEKVLLNAVQIFNVHVIFHL